MQFITKFRKPILVLFTLVLLLLIGQQALAQDSILPECAATGDCTLCDIIQTAVNAGKVVLGIIGSLVLLMFVYGGFLMLTSAGKTDQIQKGKNVLINSVIGLAIILSAYLVVITVVTVITGQEWNMNTIQGKLTCVPLSFEPVDQGGYANLSAYINQPDEGGTTGENAACKKSSECSNGLFCNDTKKCQKKLGTGATCKGKTIEAKEWADSKGISIAAISFGLTGLAADQLMVLTKSNAACLSDDCNALNLSGFGKCDAPDAGQGNVDLGGACGGSNDCKGGYCDKNTKKCTAYKNLGQDCNGLATDEDNRVCGPLDSISQCDDSPCGVHTCSNKCVPGPKAGNKGEYCTQTDQCKNPYVCIANSYGGKTGKCLDKLKLNDPCNGFAITPDTDNSLCETGDCQLGATGGRCQE